MTQADLDDVWRREAPRVLGALVRRYGDFDLGEDAVQEALIAASVQWPRSGVPDNPRGWLVRVASRRLIDTLRSEGARADRERAMVQGEPADVFHAPAADLDDVHPQDDTLQLLLLCCHPALSQPSQVALTLRAVGGLTTAQIAAAFLVPAATMAQRISRAKANLRSAEARFGQPAVDELPDRVAAVLHVLYLIFNEGYTSSGGDQLVDVSLTHEAIRLTRELRGRLPSHEAAGLLALMLLTDARARARTDERGDLVPLEAQDRSLWDQAAIREGVAILEGVLADGDVGPFQLQAAIAAVHAGPLAGRRQTGWRSPCCTECSTRSRPARRSPSTSLLQSVWRMDLLPDSPWSTPRSSAPKVSVITAPMPCGHTCSRWLAARPKRSRSTRQRHVSRRAFPSRGTSLRASAG